CSCDVFVRVRMSRSRFTDTITKSAGTGPRRRRVELNTTRSSEASYLFGVCCLPGNAAPERLKIAKPPTGNRRSPLDPQLRPRRYPAYPALSRVLCAPYNRQNNPRRRPRRQAPPREKPLVLHPQRRLLSTHPSKCAQSVRGAPCDSVRSAIYRRPVPPTPAQ